MKKRAILHPYHPFKAKNSALTMAFQNSLEVLMKAMMVILAMLFWQNTAQAKNKAPVLLTYKNNVARGNTHMNPGPNKRLPVASNDVATYVVGTTKTINVLANDNTGDAIDPRTVKITTAGVSANGKTLTVANQGTWTVDGTTGAITFTPLPTFKSSPAVISYTGQDANGNTSNVATVTLTSTTQCTSGLVYAVNANDFDLANAGPQRGLYLLDPVTEASTLIEANIFGGGAAKVMADAGGFAQTSAFALDISNNVIWFANRGNSTDPVPKIFSYNLNTKSHGATMAVFDGVATLSNFNKAAYNPVDGNIYFHNSGNNHLYRFNPGTPTVAAVDLGTLSVPGLGGALNTSGEVASFAGGDIAFDGLGNLTGAFSNANILAVFKGKYDGNGDYTGLSMSGEKVIDLAVTPASVAFLADGNYLVGGIEGSIKVNTNTGVQTDLGAVDFGSSDFASCVAPSPNLKVSKTATSSCTGTTTNVEYTITVSNTGLFHAINTKLKETLPAGLTLVSATLNGTAIANINNATLASGILIKSTNAVTNGQVFKDETATIVLNCTAAGPTASYSSQAFVTYNGIETLRLTNDQIPSNDPATVAEGDATVINTTGCLAISGTVFNDANGATDKIVNGTGIGQLGTAQLYAYATDAAGKVLASATVGAAGTYTLGGLAANGSYNVVVSSNSVAVGANNPTATLPSGWNYTGEFLGIGEGSDGTADGRLSVSVVNANVGNANFGLNNPPPIATNDKAAYTAGTAKTVDILANDNTGDAADPKTVKITTAGASAGGKTLTVANEGTWTIDGTTGAVTFTPLAAFKGDPTPISYTVQDNDGNVSNAATVTLDASPVASDDKAIYVSGTAKTVDVLANDNTGDAADPKTVKITTAGASADGKTLTVANEGTWTVDGTTGAVTFTPLATFKGDPTPISYTVQDNDGNVSNVAAVTLQAGAIRVTKTGTFNDTNKDGKAQAGEAISYAFKVENIGKISINGIKITDPKVTVNGGPISLAPGAKDETTFTASYTLTQADLDAGQVNNLATAEGKDSDGNPVKDDSENGNTVDPKYPAPPSCPTCTVTPLPGDPSIRLTKTGTFNDTNKDGKAQAGETITYRFTVENTGNVTISAIKVTDPKVTVNGGPISLAPGAKDETTFTATYTLTQADLDAGQVNNLATAEGKDPKGNPVKDDSENGNTVDPKYPAPPSCPTCTVTPLPGDPSIRLTKTGTFNDANGDGKAQAGETITYRFTVENTGNVTISAIKVTDPKVTVNGGPISLAPGAKDETTFTATYTLTQADLDAGQVNNLATAEGKDPKGNPVKDDSENGNTVDPKYPAPPSCPTCTVTPLPGDPSIRLTKTGTFNDANGDGKAQAGETIAYRFTVENTGNVTISDIRITDPKVAVNGGPISLAPGAKDETTFTATYTLTQADLDAGQVNNLATAEGKDSKGNPVKDDSENGNTVDPKYPAPPSCPTCTVTPLPTNSAIALVKQVTNKGTGINGAFVLGNTIEYTFTITNSGSTTLSNMVLSDQKLSPTPFTLPGTLAPGASTIAKKTYVIVEADIEAGKVTNTAVVTATDPKGNPVTDRSGSDVNNDNPTVTVTAKPPVAVNDQITDRQNKQIVIPVLANDMAGDAPLDPMGIVITKQPAHGKVVGSTDGTVSYKPEKDFHGQDSFTYTVRDGNGQVSNPANVGINVMPSKPVAVDDEASTQYNAPVQIAILNNDKEDGAPFQKNTVEIMERPLHGTVTVSAEGIATYLPNPGFTGKDKFTYQLKDDNNNLTNIANVSIAIEGFFIPNVFTPNGDGKNDTFFIVGIDSYETVNIEIYNRWENLVYKMNAYKNDWTGNGLNEGTYFYKIVLKKGGQSKTVAGPVLLKR